MGSIDEGIATQLITLWEKRPNDHEVLCLGDWVFVPAYLKYMLQAYSETIPKNHKHQQRMEKIGVFK